MNLLKLLLSIVSLFGLSLSPLIAQPSGQDYSLPGIIVVQNSKYYTGKVQYVSGASIRATRSTPTTSDANGKFRLIFSDIPPGGTATLIVKKVNMEVVNAQGLKNATVVGRKDPLKVIMADKDKLTEAKLAFLEISEEAIYKKHNQQIAILKKSTQESQKLLNELQTKTGQPFSSLPEAIAHLEEQLAKQLELAQAYGEKFAEINLDDASEASIEVYEAFSKGEMEKVFGIIKLEEQNGYLADIQKEKQKVESLKEEIEKREKRLTKQTEALINNNVMAARAAMMVGEWEKAEAYYTLAVEADTSKLETLLGICNLLFDQGQGKKLVIYATRFLSLAQTPADQMNALNYLGLGQQTLYRHKEAISSFEQAIEVGEESMEQTPYRISGLMARAYNNLGLEYIFLNQPVKAASIFNKATDVWEKYKYMHPGDFDYSFELESLMNLGVALRLSTDLVEAQKVYQVLLHSMTEWADLFSNTDSVRLQANLAKIYDELGIISRNMFQPTEALDYYQKSLYIREKLASQNPSRFAGQLAGTLNNLGKLYVDVGAFQKAIASYNRALKLAQQLAEKNPKKFQPEVSRINGNLSELYFLGGDYPTAYEYGKTSVELIRPFAEKDSQNLIPFLAHASNNMGRSLFGLGKMADALDAHIEAFDIYEFLVKADTFTFLPDLARTTDYMGICYYYLKDFPTAIRAHSYSVTIAKAYIEDAPDTYLPQLAQYLTNLGLAQAAQPDQSEAITTYEESLEIYQELYTNKPDQHGPSMAMAYDNLGISNARQGNFPAAVSAFENGLLIREKLYQQYPSRFKSLLIQSLQNLSYVHEDMGDKAKKEEYEERIRTFGQN